MTDLAIFQLKMIWIGAYKLPCKASVIVFFFFMINNPKTAMEKLYLCYGVTKTPFNITKKKPCKAA